MDTCVRANSCLFNWSLLLSHLQNRIMFQFTVPKGIVLWRGWGQPWNQVPQFIDTGMINQTHTKSESAGWAVRNNRCCVWSDLQEKKYALILFLLLWDVSSPPRLWLLPNIGAIKKLVISVLSAGGSGERKVKTVEGWGHKKMNTKQLRGKRCCI